SVEKTPLSQRRKRGTRCAPVRLKRFVQPAIERRFRYCAIKHVDNLTVFENHDRRYTTNSKATAQFTFSFGIHFHKAHFTATLLRDIFKNWCEITAGAAPRCPEVDHHR